MNSKSWRGVGFGIIALFAAGGALSADQHQEMTPEQKAGMEAWMKAMTPGPEHQGMAANAGNWNATVTMWEAAGAAPQVSQAKSVRKMILGGRVMTDEWTGNMMGMPFEGRGTTGYDNVSKKWWGTWTDNMTTGLMTTSGTCDPDPKKGCVYIGSGIDPMTGKPSTTRQIVVWPNADEERMEMYGNGPDGKEFKMMEIVSKRAK